MASTPAKFEEFFTDAAAQDLEAVFDEISESKAAQEAKAGEPARTRENQAPRSGIAALWESFPFRAIWISRISASNLLEARPQYESEE